MSTYHNKQFIGRDLHPRRFLVTGSVSQLSFVLLLTELPMKFRLPLERVTRESRVIDRSWYAGESVCGTVICIIPYYLEF